MSRDVVPAHVVHRGRDVAVPSPLRGVVSRLSRMPAWTWDIGLALLLFLADLAEMRLTYELFSPLGETAAFPVLAGIATLRAGALALRRRFPLAVSLVASATLISLPMKDLSSLFESFAPALAAPLQGDPGWWPTAIGWTSTLEALVGVYTVTALRGRWLGRVSAVWFGVSLTPWILPQVITVGPAAALYLPLIAWLAFYLGDVRRLLLLALSQIAERSRRIEEGRVRAVRDAAESERGKVSAELQGLVARNLDQMVNQAAAAREALEAEGGTPEARDAIAIIERTGRTALDDARRALGLLRDENGRAPRTPLARPPAAATAISPPADPAKPAVRKRKRDRGVGLADTTLSLVLMLFMVSEIGLAGARPPWQALDVLADPLDLSSVVLLTLPLILRRLMPLPVSFLVTGAFAMHAGAGHFFALSALVALLTGVYSVFAERGVTQGLVALAGAAAVIPLATEALAAIFQFGLLTVYLPFLTGAALLGLQERRLQVALSRRREQEKELAQAAEAEVRSARTTERLRIARELHDVTAHSLSVMTIQAGAARTVAESQRSEALRALSRVEETGRQAQAELEHLFEGGFLRRISEPELRHGIESIPVLAGEMREAGLEVDLDLPSTIPRLSPGLDLSLFRVVQEALTNAAKHAGETRARVGLRCEGDTIVLEVVDDGPRRGSHEDPGGAPGVIGGRGLIGMHERVRAFGGTLTTGKRPTRGFAVRVQVPLTLQGAP